MITRFLFIATLSLTFIVAETLPEDLLRQGLFEEEANRDFDKASERYRAVVAAHDRQRSLAATATFRLGEIARKKNDKDTAAAAFRTVVERFPEQADLARMSRENLAALGMVAPMTPAADPGAEAPSKDPEEAEIERLKNLARSSPDLIDGATDIGWRPLHLAAANGQMKVMAYLLERKADVNSRTTQEQLTPLQLAAINGHLAAVNALLAAKAKIDEEFYLKSDFDKRLPPKDERAKKISGYWTALDLAVLYDRREVARALIKAGADIKRTGPDFLDDSKFTALMEAIYLERDEIAMAMIEAGAPLGVAGGWNSNSPLVLAIRFNSELAPILLKAGADPNLPCGQAQDTPLQCAVDRRQLDLAQLLIESGAEVKAVNANGLTALHFAHTQELVDLLISKGADPSAKDKNGFTALDAMAAQGDSSIAAVFVKLLDRGGTVVDAKALLARSSSEMLPVVRDRVAYPKEWRADAVLLSVEDLNRPKPQPDRIRLMDIRSAPGSPPPSIGEGMMLLPNGGNFPPEIKNLKVVRRDAKGRFTVVFDWTFKRDEPARKDLPDLEWGDILELTLVSNYSMPQASRFYESLAPRTVSGRLGGMSFQRKLTNPGEIWLGKKSTDPIVGRPARRSPEHNAFIQPLPLIPDFVDSSRISVTRKGVEKPILVNLSMKDELPFRLIDGDEIDLVLQESVREDLRKNNKQLLLTTDFKYGGVATGKGLFSTLAASGQPPNLTKYIDFSSVKVLRGGDVEKFETFDLVKIVQEKDWIQKDLAKVDALQAGDWILVSPLADDASPEVVEMASVMAQRLQTIGMVLASPELSAPRVIPAPGQGAAPAPPR